MLLTAVVVGGYLYLRLDDEVRRYAEKMLADHYTDLDIRVGSAHFETGRGVVLRDLVISDNDQQGNLLPIAEVDEVQLLGPFDVESMASGQSRVERVRVRLARIQAVRATDGRWNLSKLFPPPSMGGKPADVELVDAVITLTDNCDGHCRPVTLREVNLSTTCTAFSEEDPEQRTFQITGSVGGELAESFTFTGTADTGSNTFDGKAEVVGFDLDSTAAISLRQRANQVANIKEINGKANLSIVGHVEPNQAPTWSVNYQIAGARISLDNIPRPLTEINASGTASQSHLLVQQATAMFGQSKLALAVQRHGWEANAPTAISARAEQFTIDDNLARLLPASAIEPWNRFQPRGVVSVEMGLQFNGHTWRPSATIDCHDVSFIDHEKFDYRLTGGKGRLTITDRGDGNGPVLDINNLTAMLDLTPIHFQGSFGGLSQVCDHCGPNGEKQLPTGWLEATGERIQITDSLVDAIEPDKGKIRQIVDSLDAKGRVSIRWKYIREQPTGGFNTETDLTFHDGHVRFENFKYPLDHIEGTAHERNGNWRFDNLVSQQPGSPLQVRASGTCDRLEDGTFDMLLTFVGQQVPLDDTLLHALPPAHQDAWRAVHPISGRVNFYAQVAHRLGANASPNIYLQAAPIDDLVAIEPAEFPYRLERLQGKFVVVNNQVTFTNLRGAHGQTVFETDGSWVPYGQGGWQLDFQNLNVDRLAADFDLKRAAPQIGKVVEYLNPTGTFSIHKGELRFTRDSGGSTHLRSEWRLSLGCQQNDIELGVPIRSVTGLVHLVGRHEGSLQYTAGRLELDSLFWNGMQFTNVRGPVWVDSYECRMGREAAQRMKENNILGPEEKLSRIETQLYGGTLALDAKVPLQTGLLYVLDLAVDNCDLKRMSTDYFGGAVDLSGTLSGQAIIQGMGHSLELLQGGGRMAVRDAQLYELPVMARMLKVLRNRVPDKTAFNGIDAQFTIDGQTVRFSELNLLGDAVSLYGQGTTTFDRQLDLKFYSTVGRNDYNIPLLRSMIGQASANLLLIKVTGPAENAQVERAPLPAVNEFMDQLGGDGVATPRPQRGFWTR